LDGRAAAQAAVDAAHKAGGHVSAFFCESILSCGGQVVLPAGYLQQVYDVMHQAGAVCIADEVQESSSQCLRFTCRIVSTEKFVPDVRRSKTCTPLWLDCCLAAACDHRVASILLMSVASLSHAMMCHARPAFV